MVVGTVVQTVIVGRGVPTRVVGTAANTFFVPTIIVGTIVPTIIVGTAVPTIIVLMAYYWKSCVLGGRPSAGLEIWRLRLISTQVVVEVEAELGNIH